MSCLLLEMKKKRFADKEKKKPPPLRVSNGPPLSLGIGVSIYMYL